MRKRNLEHIFKHIILFIAIILPILVCLTCLTVPLTDLDANNFCIVYHVDGNVTSVDYLTYDQVKISNATLRSSLFEFKLYSVLCSIGLRPFAWLGFDEYGSPYYNPGNPISNGAFQLISFLMGSPDEFGNPPVNIEDVFGAIQYTQDPTIEVGLQEMWEGGDTHYVFSGVYSVSWAEILCMYLTYILYVYIFYFLIELLLFVPRLGVQFGEKFAGSKGDVEW